MLKKENDFPSPHQKSSKHRQILLVSKTFQQKNKGYKEESNVTTFEYNNQNLKENSLHRLNSGMEMTEKKKNQ